VWDAERLLDASSARIERLRRINVTGRAEVPIT
jgi:hypothetical protein